jgi:hypothetical protein
MITTTILQVLFNCDGVPVRESVLLAETRIAAKRCGENEFATALVRLRQGGYAASSEDPLTGDTLWVITKKGIKRVEGK